MAAGVDTSMYLQLAASLEEFNQLTRLGQRFTSRKRHPSSGLIEEWLIFADFTDNLIDGSPVAHRFMGQ